MRYGLDESDQTTIDFGKTGDPDEVLEKIHELLFQSGDVSNALCLCDCLLERRSHLSAQMLLKTLMYKATISSSIAESEQAKSLVKEALELAVKELPEDGEEIARIQEVYDELCGNKVPGYVRYYFIRLFYENMPSLDKNALLQELKRIDPAVKPLGDDELFMFVNENYRIPEVTGNAGSPVTISTAERINKDEIKLALSQTWDWPEAPAVLSRCPHVLLMWDYEGYSLNPRDRLENLQKFLAALIKLYPPNAVLWRGAQRFVNPEKLGVALSEKRFADLENGALNVRLFRVDEKQCIMDTIGLEYFKLPDLQCSFHTLDPKDVAGMLYTWAEYLFEKGDVIDTGHTIDGCDGLPWTCTRRDSSLVDPDRRVLDLNPGEYAGER